MTVDGTDCPICEPQPFSAHWYSHKFKGAGLRYEVGVCIQTGDIVWVNGAYPCGSWPDLKIFRHRLKGMLGPNEMVEADKAYRDEKCRLPGSYVSVADRQAHTRARARHEAVNARLKIFQVLRKAFNHNIHDHQHCFFACAVITQLAFNNNEQPWQVNY
jgi:hypothetical protein